MKRKVPAWLNLLSRFGTNMNPGPRMIPKHQRRPYFCPNCGVDFYTWKRACSRECHAALVARDNARKEAA